MLLKKNTMPRKMLLFIIIHRKPTRKHVKQLNTGPSGMF